MKKFLIFPVLLGVLVFSGCGKTDKKIVEEVKIQGEEMVEDNLDNNKKETEEMDEVDEAEVEENFIENKVVNKKVEVKESVDKVEVKNEKDSVKDENEDEKSEEEDEEDSIVMKEGEDKKEDESTNETVSSNNNSTENATMSSGFIESLLKCSPNKESFKHPFSGETLNRKVVGLENDKCVYEEQMPGSMTLRCKYSKESLKNVVEYHKRLTDSSSIKTKSVTNGDGDMVTVTVVDGVELDFSMNDILNKECTF
ncbi:MAG: hypothetical protein KAT32_01520 [Candidatus Moranbacteria bacterium]|nr:hypothetical protein [Candidatus Moranbacteria bacterium]